jgi:glycosyltransferase involved in cell wall biosynthesis
MTLNIKNNYILTIVTVVYNDFLNIEKTLLSVKKIKCSQIQYIVIDGKSNDGTLELIDKYKDIIDIIISEKDDGIYDAMNKGLKNAFGDTIIFLNGGDIFHDDFNPIKVITKYDYKNTVLIGRSLQIYKSDIYIRPSLKYNNLLLQNPAHQAIFVPKSKYSIIKYNVNLKIAADYYWIQDILRDSKYVILKEIISIFSLGGKSTSKIFIDILLLNKEMKYKFPYFKTIIKFLLFNLLGRKLAFRFIYRNKYTRINNDFIK